MWSDDKTSDTILKTSFQIIFVSMYIVTKIHSFDSVRANIDLLHLSYF